MRPNPVLLVRPALQWLVLPALLLVLCAPHARASSFAWDDSTCAMGGNRTGDCWTTAGFPNGFDDSAVLSLDMEGSVTIPTSFLFNIKVNSPAVTENVSSNISDNGTRKGS